MAQAANPSRPKQQPPAARTDVRRHERRTGTRRQDDTVHDAILYQLLDAFNRYAVVVVDQGFLCSHIRQGRAILHTAQAPEERTTSLMRPGRAEA